jgi:hypothetical protein
MDNPVLKEAQATFELSWVHPVVTSKKTKFGILADNHNADVTSLSKNTPYTTENLRFRTVSECVPFETTVENHYFTPGFLYLYPCSKKESSPCGS